MKVITVRNVNSALQLGLDYLRLQGVPEPSRNGPVLVAPGPVVTCYEKPTERVLFNAQRDANPFFHLFESLWMLAGRNDVALPAHYAQQMQLYSDDNKTLNGSAYGHRWRTHFGYDQLAVIAGELRDNPASRRCVLAMWDATECRDYQGDLNFAMAGGKDIPCNTQVYFRVNKTALEMTVCNRSNDVVWGAYGANAVHFSMLHEYMAEAVGASVGRYYQLSNNYHIYTERDDVRRLLGSTHLVDDRYCVSKGSVVPTPLRIGDWRLDDWAQELHNCVGGSALPSMEAHRFTQTLFKVAAHMASAHDMYKNGSPLHGIKYLRNVLTSTPPYDWLVAGAEWLQRRVDKAAGKVKS